MPEPAVSRHSRVRRWHVDGQPALEQVMHHRPGQEWAPHWHEEWSIGAVLAGRCRFSLGGRRHTALAGDLLAIAPGAVHTCGLDADEGGATQVVMVYAAVPWLAALGVPMPQRSARAMRPALAADARDLRDSADASAWLRRAAALLADGASLLPVDAEPAGRAAQQVLAALQRAAVGDGTVAIDALARDCALSREHFHRIATRWLGLSPGDYVRAARMARARRLLLDGWPIAQAAQACGFADQAHLTRWFSRHFGYTPGALAQAAHAGLDSRVPQATAH
jgi:AraC-like DNA-binding protein/quercetin dioxygenase-like cupin family protein